MKKAIRFGIPAEAAVMAATVNPARSVSAEDQAGSIECGRRADILICSREYDLLEVYAGGEKAVGLRKTV